MRYGWFDELLLKLAVQQSGAFAGRQALDAGGSNDQLRRRERTGQIRRIRNGIYVHGGFARCWRQDLWLEHLAAGAHSAVAGHAAAQLHGFRRFTDERVEVQVARGGNHDAVRGTVHETFWQPAHHVTTIEGLPVTTVARTVFDLAGLPRHPATFRNDGLLAIHTKRITWLVNQAIRDHGMRMTDLHKVLAAIGRRGKTGTAVIRAVVADLGLDYVPTDSELEDLFLEVCAAYGIPEPDGQVDLGTKDRWVGRVDFVWRVAKLIAEIDGGQHRAPLDRRADRARDADFEREGGRVIRVTWWELVHEPEAVVAQLRAHLSFSR